MAVFDPETLNMMQDIYREVMAKFSDASLNLSERAKEEIAQDILRLVRCGEQDRDELLESLLSRLERRNITGGSLGDLEQPTKNDSR